MKGFHHEIGSLYRLYDKDMKHQPATKQGFGNLNAGNVIV
jgi:hypothetical protein